jgi:hypothetical protein
VETKIHYVAIMQSFYLLKLVVHERSIGLSRVKGTKQTKTVTEKDYCLVVRVCSPIGDTNIEVCYATSIFTSEDECSCRFLH